MIKKAIIEHDEFEHHERKALNYGHSFGHAIEAASGYRISHGEAVLHGILIVSKMFKVSDEIINLVEKYVDLSRISHLKDDIMHYLHEDKKVTNGVISLVVATEPGKTVFIDQTLDEVGEKLCDIF
jgi:3-dehydroquinate synthetase